MNRHARLLSLLCLASCLRANDQALFESNEGSPATAAASAAGSSSSGAQSGTDSGAGAQSSSGTGATAGSLSQSGSSGSGGSGGSGGSSAEPAAGSGNQVGGASSEPPQIVDCAMLEDAVTSELNGHCYRVNEAELTFAQAREACHSAGGHLVTISSEAEDAFAEALHDGEHWIGATDGRADTMSGVGTYTWVGDEPFDYSHWEEGQPNAFETDCPEGGNDADCFEHCAFQSDEGDWNDRSCWHTIVSICEWDIGAGTGAVGDAGSAP